jgi:Anti-sigma-K factor rskA, C-terminal/Putative zinc-finger
MRFIVNEVGQNGESMEERTPVSHDAIGAYLLGALPDDEQREFEQHLAGCESCQRELAELRPVAALLPRIYDDLMVEAENGLESAAPGETVKTEILARAEVEKVERVEEVDEAEGEQPVETTEVPDGVEEAVLPVERAEVEAAADLEVAEEAPVTGDEPVAEAEPAEEAAVEEAAVVEEESAVAGAMPQRVGRPRGRVAPGLSVMPGTKVSALPRLRRATVPWLLAAALAVVAVGAILWALAMMGQVDDLEEERDFQDQQIAEMTTEREAYLAQTPAIVFRLSATTTGAENSSAVVFADPSGEEAILTVEGLHELSEDRAYQLWYLSENQDVPPEPGPLFRTDSEGKAIVPIRGDVADFYALAVTEEPSAGSEAPTSNPIIQGLTA